MSVGTRGCGSNGIIASDRGLLAAELEAIPSIDTEDLQYWSQVCSEFLPCLENLAVDEAAAVATSAWMYEVFSRVGWDLSLVM